jgi:hypothetical protein
MYMTWKIIIVRYFDDGVANPLHCQGLLLCRDGFTKLKKKFDAEPQEKFRNKRHYYAQRPKYKRKAGNPDPMAASQQALPYLNHNLGKEKFG